jgi:hypothetical protein
VKQHLGPTNWNGDRDRVPLSEVEQHAAVQDERLLDLNEALTRLEADDPQKATLVKSLPV